MPRIMKAALDHLFTLFLLLEPDTEAYEELLTLARATGPGGLSPSSHLGSNSRELEDGKTFRLRGLRKALIGAYKGSSCRTLLTPRQSC